MWETLKSLLSREHKSAEGWWHWGYWNKRINRFYIREFVKKCKRVHNLQAPVLDAGAGYRNSYPEVLLDPFETLDQVADFKPTYVGSIMSMPAVPSERYRTVLCTEVLEHVSRPWEALAEIKRVLMPGGTLVLTTPFWYEIHEKDFQSDYFRYTPRGITSLLQDAGFEKITVETRCLYSWWPNCPDNIFTVAYKPETV